MSLRDAAERLVNCAAGLKKLDPRNPALEQALTDIDCAEVELEAAYHQDTEAPSELREAALRVVEACTTFRNTTPPQHSNHDRIEFMRNLKAMDDAEDRLAEVLKGT